MAIGIAELVKATSDKLEAVKQSAKEISDKGLKEYGKGQLEHLNDYEKAVLAKMDDIKNLSPEQLHAKMQKTLEDKAKQAEKAKIKEETGWSDEVVEAIGSTEEYEIYKKAGLHEAEINGRECLVKDIDMDYVDPKTGKTNRELMAEGRSPYDSKTGERLELHHMGQDFDSPLAELCENSEHGDGNDKILHDKHVESWRQNPELKNRYNNVERPNHWMERAKEA